MSKVLLMLLIAGAGFWPLPFDNGITGTFSEYRFQHIHAGFDYSTKGDTGFPISCFENGIVLQVKIFKRGYGKVIYIKHPEKKVISVYGHLEKFTPEIEKIVKQYQTLRKTKYPGVIFLENKNISFKKDQIIGYSGETGVGYPHFHFELRDFKNNPLNPLEHGLILPVDKKAPVIEQLNIFPVDCFSSINGKCDRLKLNTEMLKDKTYKFNTVKVVGNSALSLKTYDLTKNGGKLGIKKIEYFVNGKLVYKYEPNYFSFTNYNESILVYDFSETSLSPTFYTYNLFKVNGGKLAAQWGDPGFYIFKSGLNKLLIQVTDFSGNTSLLKGDLIYEEKSDEKNDYCQFVPFFSVNLNGKEVLKANELEINKTVFNDKFGYFLYLDDSSNEVKIGDCKISVTGFNKEKMLLNVKKIENFPKWELPAISGTFLEFSPNNSFIKNLSLKYMFKKIKGKAGIYRYDSFKEKWFFIQSEPKGNELLGSGYKPAIYGVFIDNFKPKVSGNIIKFKKLNVIKIEELGMGINDESIFLENKKTKNKTQMEYDPDRKWAFTEETLEKGKYTLTISDLAGNTSKANIIYK